MPLNSKEKGPPKRQPLSCAPIVDGAAQVNRRRWVLGHWRAARAPCAAAPFEARCACGNTFKTRSTKPELHLEICSVCHPFFTGRQKLIDTEGRVERFTKKFGAQTSEQRRTAAKAAKATKTAATKRTRKASTA